MNAADFAARLDGVHASGDGFAAKCPAHEDRRASLSITDGDKGVVLLCHAGCPTEDVVRAKGLTMADLFNESQTQPTRPRQPVPSPLSEAQVAGMAAALAADPVAWTHVTETLRLDAEVVRKERLGLHVDRDGRKWIAYVYAVGASPTFANLRSIDGDKAFRRLPAGQRTTLYRGDALEDGGTAVVTEGERDALAALTMGLAAEIGNAGGCAVVAMPGANHHEVAVRALRGQRKVYIATDADEAGDKAAAMLIAALGPMAVRLRPPGAKDIGDVLVKYGREKGLDMILQAAREADSAPVKSAATAITESVETPINRTDAGNAERLAARHGDRIRYVHGWDRWHLWDGSRWARDERREVERLAIASARAILVEAAGVADSTERSALVKHALRSEERHAIDDALAIARALPPVAAVPDDLDRDLDLLNLPNGTLDLSTGKLIPHDPAHLITKASPVPWDPGATAPTWAAFLARVAPDPDVRAYLQRAVGYSLTGNVTEHALFFCYGSGANGKSTFLETVRELLGEGEAGYAKAAAPHLLLAQKQDRHLAEVADLRGARFVTTVEVGQSRAWDESRVKWLTGGDMISARLMYGNPFSFHPTHKFWIAGNHKPKVNGTDLGFWRRVHIVPFTVTIPKEEQDPDLRAKLRAELPGILRWAVAGCVAWRQGGLRPAVAITEATQHYREAEDVVGLFIAECCSVGPSFRVQIGELHPRFKEWAERNGERPMSKRAFGDALEDRGIKRSRSMDHRSFVGIALREIAA